MTPATSSVLSKSTDFVLGEKWGGIPSLRTRIRTGTTLTNPPVALSSVRMIWRHMASDSQITMTLSSASSTITISSTTTWTIAIPAQFLTSIVRPGTYVWSVLYTDTNSLELTYLRGSTTVLPTS